MAKETQGNTNQKAGGLVEWLADRQLAICALWVKAQLLRPDCVILALSWGALAFLELVLHLFIRQSTFYSHDLPLGARVLLFCYSLSVLTVFLIFTGALTKIAVSISKRFFPNHLAMRWIERITVTFFVWLILIFYGASWGLFWQTGSFIGSDVFIFMAPHPLQVFHWVDLDIAVVILGFASAGTIAITVWLPRWTVRRKPLSQQRLIRIWRYALGFSLAGAFLGSLYGSWGERQHIRAGILYSRNQDNNSGPFSYIVADFAKYLSKTTESLSLDNSLRIDQRSVIPMTEYKTLADPSQHHRWNVLILTVESLRADQLRAYGGKRDVMPAVETLASEARVFLNTYTQSSHTNYATITPLSSHYPLRSPTAHTYPKNPTYPRVLIYDVLKAMGYHTAIFSSSNETWGGMVNYLDTGSLDRFIHAANSKKPTYLMPGDAGFAIWARETKNAGSLDDRSTVDEAIQWIDGLDNEAFFIAMNFQNSHLPYPVPPEFPRRFGPGNSTSQSVSPISPGRKFRWSKTFTPIVWLMSTPKLPACFNI